jgi:hypothetical protein
MNIQSKKMGKNVTLGYLGYKFQTELINQLLHPANKKFSDRIIDIVHAKYFDNEYFRLIVAQIKDYYEKYEKVPAYDTLETIFRMEIKDKVTQDYVFEMLNEIRELVVADWEFVQGKALNFCRQQELKKANEKINKIVDNGEFDNYETCAEILREALAVGSEKDDGTSITENIEAVLEKDFRHPIPTGINGIDNLTDGGLSRGELGVILAPYGVGKAQPVSSKILTPTGWKLMGEISVGDYVIGSDGKKQKVLGVYPQGKRPIYDVYFSDGTKTQCDEEHLWAVNKFYRRNRKIKGKWDPNHDFEVLPLSKIKDNLYIKTKKQNFKNYLIPQVNPVEFDFQNIKLDPYVLGVMLGDGCLNKSMCFDTKDDDIINNVSQFYGKNNISINEYFRDVKTDDDVLVKTKNIKRVRLLKAKPIFEGLGLFNSNSKTKFIPKNYLYNSVWVREKVLQGLIDTDGWIDGHLIGYSTVSEQLMLDVRELVLSLGGTCIVKEKNVKYLYKENFSLKKSYSLTISFPNNDITPSLCNRKISRFKYRTKYEKNKFITEVKYSHEEDAQCIYVENDDHLYVTDDFILTHNTTILTKIANSAYNEGYNVLQIVFEDMPDVIKRKHLACWSGINLNELADRKEEVLSKHKEVTSNRTNDLRIRKFSSEGVTMQTIKSFVRHEISTGFKPDMIVLDYIDCVESTKHYSDEWSGEGNVMRGFESMLNEFSLVGWTAVQGNRSSISSDVVTGDQMGGSIKKAQIGHFIMSIARTLPQKEAGRATIAVLKSRFGRDGVVFEDCTFDNGRVYIDTEASHTFLGYEKKQEEKKEAHTRDRIQRAKELQKQNN